MPQIKISSLPSSDEQKVLEMRTNTRSPFFILLLFILSFRLSAQQHKQPVEQERSLSLTLMAARNAFSDHLFTSSPYRAWAPQFKLSYDKGNSNQRQYINASFSAANFTNDNNSSFTAKQQSVMFDYTKLFSIRRAAEKLNFFAGGSFSAVYNNRTYKGFINTDASFEFISSLQAVAAIEFLIGEKNDLRLYLKDKFQFPLVSLLYQPSFASAETAGQIAGKKGVSNFFSSSVLASFNRYLAADNTLCLTKEISRTTNLSLQYDFIYRKLTTQRPVNHLNHAIGIMVEFHL